MGTDKTWKLKCYTILKIIIKCHINVKKLRVILNNEGFHLTQIRNKSELDQLLQNVNPKNPK